MKKFLGIISRGINLFSNFLAHVSIWGVLILMILIVIDIFMRILIKRSILIAEEIGGYLLVLISYLGMGETLKKDRHVKVETFSKKLPEKIQIRINIILSFIALIALIFVIWRVFIMVYASYKSDAIVPGVFLTPIFLPQMLIIIGLLGLILQQILILGKNISKSIWNK